jgi:two-component system nitrate/nitrite sensor histidine kinase NarX
MRVSGRFWRQSILVRLGIAMGLIAVLALASIVSSAVFTGQSEGKAGAINVAGSLRMQSYLIASTVANPTVDAPEKRAQLERHLAEFAARLRSPALLAGLPADPASPLRQAHQRTARAWATAIEPGARRAAADPDAQAVFLREVGAFVGDVDRLVKLLEEDLEGRIQALRLYQGIALFLIVAVIFAAMYLMHTQVVIPLSDLLACARAVRSGNFGVRAAGTGQDELGQLGTAFNIMVQDLSRMYATLEARVAEKTQELERTNRSLELLYNTTRTLSEGAPSNETFRSVLADVERVVGVRTGVICAQEAGQSRGFPLVATVLGEDGRPALCRQSACEECYAGGELRERSLGSAGSLLSVPLTDGGRTYGVMPLALPPGQRLEPWQLKLVEAVGRHIGTALATARRTEERHRLALFEERSVIARELHDSLAQSLSYLKIQVARLQAQLAREGQATQAGEIVAELKTGIANAYRQLRELLTTFRLRIEGRGLGPALEDTVTEYSRRSGLDIRLDNRLAGVELASNEEIHVLQVIREALSNVEHHAQAQRVDISLDRGPDNGVRVRIDDDGRGIGDMTARPHHYGLAIMRDRAASLGGTLAVARREPAGTRVELAFTAATPFRDAATVAA